MNQHIRTAAGAGLLLMLNIPLMRRIMESDMAYHMLLQFPLILLAGWLLAKTLPTQIKTGLQAWNHLGITGLLAASMILMFWMIPRALDLVLVNPALEFFKFVSLALAGMALAWSWPAAGMIVRGFFLGNVLPMMMVVGWLYVEAPVRLCNSYLSNDQLHTGRGLLALSIAGSLLWLYAFFMPACQTGNGNTM